MTCHRPPAPTPSVLKPQVDLGLTLDPIVFAPGRYASVIQISTRGTHALQPA